VGKADGKRYTFILKDTILPKNPSNGREQATISYEYDFTATSTKNEDETMSGDDYVFVNWNDLVPTYRGKEKKNAEKLDTSSIKRISIMMRRYSSVVPLLSGSIDCVAVSLATKKEISP
jgi:hypothetical protein